MAETLGSLCDKLTIVKLKQWHTDDPARSILHAANVHADGRLVDDSSVLVAYLDGAQSC